MKWKMKGNKKFVAQEGEYTAVVTLGAAFGYAHWVVIKDQTIVDEIYNHHGFGSKFNGELSAKAAAERSVKKLLSLNPNT